ncbi:MAG TPA: hypothetical protein VK177_07080 [Flavobacteriales bacterium]|nr:hypothetical protein [Flavobacteriales bacterium]
MVKTTFIRTLSNIFIFICAIACTPVYGQHDTVKKTDPFLYEANLRAGYQYGFIQGYTFDDSFPDQLFLTEGSAGFNVFSFPFQVEFRYATMRVPYGLNNYFRIRFNAEKYRQQLQEKKNELNQLRKFDLDTLYRQRQELYKKLLYRQYLLDEFKKKSGLIPRYLPGKPVIYDTLNKVLNSLDTLLVDSIAYITNSVDTLLVRPHFDPGFDTGKISVYGIANPFVDSVAKLQQQITVFQNEISGIEKKIDSIQEINKKTDFPENQTGKMDLRKKFKLRNLEIGTCYPNNSYLMYGTLPVNGFFSDFEFKGIYMSVLYGEVMNNFLFANTYFERQLLSTKNVTNFFDFANTNRGRKVAAVKIGKGDFYENHVHLGMLYGTGLQNYGDTLLVGDAKSNTKEDNFVAELSGKYTIGKHCFNAAIAKSLVEEHRSGKLLNGLMDLSKYSLAAFLSYNTAFFKGKTELKVMAKHLQPYYRSFGMGFVNNDCLRLNAKVNHRISQKMNIGAFVKNDLDNLYNLVAVTNNILNFGLNTQYRITRGLNLRLTYNPIVQKINYLEQPQQLHFKSYLYNGSLSYTKRLKKNSFQSSLNVNYFKINTINSTTNEFQNINFSNTFTCSQFSFNFTSSYFSTNIIDSVAKNNLMNALQVNLKIKKVGVKAGIKHYTNLATLNDFGYNVGLNVPVGNGFSFVFEGQKFVVGDYFLNTIQVSKKEPYCFSAALEFRW